MKLTITNLASGREDVVESLFPVWTWVDAISESTGLHYSAFLADMLSPSGFPTNVNRYKLEVEP